MFSVITPFAIRLYKSSSGQFLVAPIIHSFLSGDPKVPIKRSTVARVLIFEKQVGVYRLFIYIYFHEDFSSLVCSFLMIWFFGGGFEENVGTAKFCLLTPVFAVSSGLLYLAILATGLSWQAKVTVQGFTSVSFAMLSVFTTRSCFRRMLFFGFMVPTKVLPLLFLVLALFLPHAPFLSNVCGILVGIAYGMSGCLCLGLPESIMSRIDQTFLFRLLRRIPVWTYVPGSSAERNAAQTRKINPPPGSYPTQQYYTPPQGLHDAYSPYHNQKPTGIWPPSKTPAGTSAYSTACPPGAGYQKHMCSGGHSHLDISTSMTVGGVNIPSGNDLQQVHTQ
ncbi:rhomboid domain-containing protein 2 isoform X2 [Xenopus laevis]|uniref:Rhomboid domain-containing protein 2 isoform X2 n=1 Tax=Xenopus laevis TaxID=8355 RepID=A0A8J0UE21_XENLA|nr:rhomboid domain-containing protein 2 isoform X2 [Xenopus laevis]